MATLFPSASDDSTSLPDPASGNFLNSPSHSSLHGNANGAVKALEAKLGTGVSTPVVSRIMFGTGTGTSAWTQLTSAQLAASLTDETGTGSAVFATTPTLVTPKMDTISEVTAANGVTVDGLNIKDNKLNTNDSVVTANITNAAVTANKLATGAATGYVATSQGTATTSFTDLATVGPAVTVTIGANGLALVTIGGGLLNGTGGGYAIMSFAVSGATTQAATITYSIQNKNPSDDRMSGAFLLTGLTPGSTTFTAKYEALVGGTATFVDRRIAVVPL